MATKTMEIKGNAAGSAAAAVAAKDSLSAYGKARSTVHRITAERRGIA